MTALRIKALEEKIGIKKGKIYQLVKQGILPKPIKAGHASLWLSTEIDEALKKMAEARDRSAA